MEQFFNSFFGKILRWLFFLPLAFLASGLVELLVKSYAYLDPLGFTTFGLIFHSIIIGGIPAYVFVFVGCSVAPNFKKILSIVLSLLIVLSSGYVLAQDVRGEYLDSGILGVLLSWENIFLLVASMIGAIIAVFFICEDN